MSQNFIEELKNRISILDLISQKIKLKKHGNAWLGLCPFHSEKTPSFNVSTDKGVYHCFGCGAHGDIISFVTQYNNCTFKEAVEHLANKYAMTLPDNFSGQKIEKNAIYDVLEYAKEFYKKNLKNMDKDFENNFSHKRLTINPKEYLLNRNISQASQEVFEIGFAYDDDKLLKALLKNFAKEDVINSGIFMQNDYGTLKNRFFNRIMFPIIDNHNRCVGFGGRALNSDNMPKYLNSPETSVFFKSKILYGYNVAKKNKAKEIVICEGYLDVISMHQIGISGAVSTLGTSIHEEQMKLCWNVCNYPIIALDADAPGIKAAYRWMDKILSNLIPGKSFKFAILPEGCDPDDLVQQNKEQELMAFLSDAIPCIQWLMQGAFLIFPHSTPEEITFIYQMIDEKITLINNLDMKSLYRNEIFKMKREFLKTNYYFKPQGIEKNHQNSNNNFGSNNLNLRNSNSNFSSNYNNSTFSQSNNYNNFSSNNNINGYSINYHNNNQKRIKSTNHKNFSIDLNANCAISKPNLNEETFLVHLLIVILVNNLQIIDHVIERFVTIEYDQGVLIQIQNFIKANYLQTTFIKEDVLANLDQKSWDDIENNIEKMTSLMLDLKNNKEHEIILKRWNDVWNKYSTIPSMTNDLQNTLNDIKYKPTMEQWNKLKILKQELLSQKNNIKK